MQRQALLQFRICGTALLLFHLFLPVAAADKPVAADKKVTPSTAQDNKPRGESHAKDARSLFTPQEQQLVIQGLGNPVAQLLIMRELDRRWPLLPRQRADLQTLNREVSAKLMDLRAKRGRQERALEDAVYGQTFEPATVEALSEESAATQIELAKLQGQSEIRFIQILARGNPRRARTARAFNELLVRAGQNRPALAQLMLARQNGGPLRLLADFFADDWEMAIPGFGNPASFLLILSQLELTSEQKAAFKELSQSVRKDVQAEFAERNNPNNPAQRPETRSESQDTEEATLEVPETLPRVAAAEQIIAANAERLARQMKRQTRIEMRVRQMLQPKQWDTYVTLLRGLAVNGNSLALPNGATKKLMQQQAAPRRRQQIQPINPATE